ncbi:uncharacterized protein [Nicotiana sylvestris]|uniref:uncharacterized protein n=1 Tax=Nicotiana sylvestris TaxID=4096 RepID=UPI00388CA639
MDVIGTMKLDASNEHMFILVAIDYFTKWFEATSYKAITKKVVTDFVKDRIVCRFRVSESINTDNAANLNSELMKAMCETFKIKHKNSPSIQTSNEWSCGSRQQKHQENSEENDIQPQAMAQEITIYLIGEAELSDAEWIRSCYEQLALIDRKRMNAVCHDQLYQNRMSRAFNKRVKPRQFALEQLVLI